MKAVRSPLPWHRPCYFSRLTANRPKPKLKKVLPEVWKLIKPRRLLLGGSFLLMIINRASGLILPASTKYLIDNVMGKHQLGSAAQNRRSRRRCHHPSGHHLLSPSPNSSPKRASASSPSSA